MASRTPSSDTPFTTSITSSDIASTQRGTSISHVPRSYGQFVGGGFRTPQNRFENASISDRRTVDSQSRPKTALGSMTSGRKSRATSSLGASENHYIICAVSEARGVSPSVGIAILNISTCEAILSQVCDTQFYIRTMHKIRIFEPSRILINSASTAANGSSKLHFILENNFPDIPIVSVSRKYWSEIAGLEYVQNLAFREDIESIKVSLDGNFFAICSFSAVSVSSRSLLSPTKYGQDELTRAKVMQYMELELSLQITNHSLRIKYQPSEETMMIDLSTIVSLELIQNIYNPASKDCLYGLLNQTLTPMGRRMLRGNILQPSTEAEGILAPRFEALEELRTKEDMFFQIRKGYQPPFSSPWTWTGTNLFIALKGFVDVEKLLTQVASKPKSNRGDKR